MTCHVFLQSTADNSYTARALAFPDCVATGATREEAIANLQAALSARLAQGQIVTVEVGTATHPWMKWAARWQDDPTFDDFLADIENYRREIDAEQRADLSS